MKLKKNLNKLIKFRSLVELSKKKEESDITKILKWRNNLIKKNKTYSKIINFNKVKDWKTDNNGNVCHKSGQFFSLKGVRTKGASTREVASWDQPILTQKHGGVLAFLARNTKRCAPINDRNPSFTKWPAWYHLLKIGRRLLMLENKIVPPLNNIRIF